MNKVLIIGHVWPEPNSSAAGARMIQLIECFLQQGWSITFASASTKNEHSVDLNMMGVEISTIEINNTSFDIFIQNLKPDIVLFDRFMIEEQFGWRVEKCCPASLRILDTEDLHFLRHARQTAFKESRPLLKQDLYSDAAKREVAAILRSDLSLVISEFELELLKSDFSINENLLHYCPFMLDPCVDSESLTSYEERINFISIGNFRHSPNLDSVLWLKESIWPMIRNTLSDTELHIYGAYPTRQIMLLHEPEKGFHVKGRADSIEKAMGSARVCLAPLRFGAGLKGKLIDAMQYGTPNVTTCIGAEAMSGALPWGGFIEDSAKEIASSAVQLYENRDLWEKFQNNGLNIIKTIFNKQSHADSLIKCIIGLQAKLDRHRLENFTGAILRHHNYRSTEYMSRWIEEKNRQACDKAV